MNRNYQNDQVAAITAARYDECSGRFRTNDPRVTYDSQDQFFIDGLVSTRDEVFEYLHVTWKHEPYEWGADILHFYHGGTYLFHVYVPSNVDDIPAYARQVARQRVCLECHFGIPDIHSATRAAGAYLFGHM